MTEFDAHTIYNDKKGEIMMKYLLRDNKVEFSGSKKQLIEYVKDWRKFYELRKDYS